MARFGSRRVLAASAVALVVAGGAGVAVAASGGNPRASDFLDSVAKHLGVSPQKLKDATKAAATDQVNADLAAGRITKAQADAMKARIQAGGGVLGGPGRFGPGPGGPGGPGFAGKLFLGDELATAAKYLGLDESALRTKLENGQSLADIAKAQSKDLAGLEQAILDTAKADLDKAVADKKLTQSQADDILANLKSHIDNVANGTLRFRGPGGFGPRGGPGLAGPHFGGQQLAAAATYLGLSESDLRTKLQAGDSLADVAKAQSKDVAGLQDAIVAAQKADLDKAVAAKKLTQSQADDILANLKSHIDNVANGTLRFRGPDGFGPRGGPGLAGPHFGAGKQLAAAAQYLGLDESALRTKLENGQSLADIAKAQSKDLAG
ncbi:MAG: hypothetical protein ACXVP1_06330, partial [Thermoleophilia bacterium]